MICFKNFVEKEPYLRYIEFIQPTKKTITIKHNGNYRTIIFQEKFSQNLSFIQKKN